MACEDNQFYQFGLPGMVGPGEFLSSYVSEQVREDAYRSRNGLTSTKYDNNDVRLYHQKNASRDMSRTRQYLARTNGWIKKNPIVIMPPYKVTRRNKPSNATYVLKSSAMQLAKPVPKKIK